MEMGEFLVVVMIASAVVALSGGLYLYQFSYGVYSISPLGDGGGGIYFSPGECDCPYPNNFVLCDALNYCD